MTFLTLLAIVLAAWGVIAFVRRIAESEREQVDRTGGREIASRPTARPAADEIDYEELGRAEDEVRDLDANARPEDGFEGDDWGPGAPQPPKPPL